MSYKYIIWQAVERFKDVTHTEFVLDQRKATLNKSVLRLATEGTPEDEAEYFRLTEEITKQYQEKREKYGL